MVPKCWKSKLCSTKQQIVVGKWIDLSTKDEDFTSCFMVKTNVGWLSQFSDTHWVWFSQSNLQKGLILPQIFIYYYYFKHWARVSTFLKNK